MTEPTTEVKPIPLDQRIVSALTSTNNIPAAELLELSKEADVHATSNASLARRFRERAADPAIMDSIASRGRAEDFEFVSTRYAAGAVKLRALYDAAVIREAKAAWQIEGDAVEAATAKLANELVETYQEAVTKLVDLFGRCVAADKEVVRINGTAPRGCRQLRSVEAVARNVPSLHSTDMSVLTKTVLPALIFDRTSSAMAWPPAQPNVGVIYSEMVLNMMRGAPMPPTELERAEASRRYIEQGQADERRREQLRSEQAARVRANEEQRRLAGG